MKQKQKVTLSLAAALVLTLSGAIATNVSASAEENAASGQTYLQNYDFTTATSFDDVSRFSAGIDPSANSDNLGYTSDPWVTYEKSMSDLFKLESGLKVDTSKYSGDDVSENRIYVRYNEKQLQYFKAELTYTYDSDSRNGWAGLILGYTNYARQARWGDNPYGLELFVQREGKGTYASAKLSNSDYVEGVSASWTPVVGEHTLSVVAVESGITMYADGTEVVSISKATMSEKGYELSVGNIGFMFTNGQFTAKSFSVSPLNAEGEEYVAVEGLEVSAAAEVDQFEPLAVTATVSPANSTVKTVKYELPDSAVEVNGKIYFSKPGTYTVKAVSMDQESVYDEFTVTVKENSKYVAYATTESGAAANFDNYYVTNGGSKDGTSMPVGNYWTFNADGTMTLTEKKGSGVDSGYVLLYLKDVVNGLLVESNSFELTYMVKSSSSTPNGWHGVGFALTDRSTVPNQGGISAFIQEEALKATTWGGGIGGVGGPTETNSLYTRTEWNMVKVRVYGTGTQKIEMYVNDMSTPAITATGAGIPVANLALFTTTTVTLGNVYFAQLAANGDPIEVVYPESVDFTNAPTTAAIGDKLQLVTTITPENVTDGGLLFTSSNALVATVNSDGLVSFLGAGETTITVKCVANPAIYKEIKITVTEKEVLPTSVSFDATPTAAVVGGKYTLFVTVLPEDVKNYAVTFTSSNTAVATVDEEGRLTYVGAGETVITVKCVADESVTASFTLTVTAANDTTNDTANSTSDDTKGGCSGSLGGALCVLPMLGVAFVAMKKKKD